MEYTAGERLTLSHRREGDWIARSLRSCATLRVLTLRSKSHPSAFHFVSPPAVEPSPRVREIPYLKTKYGARWAPYSVFRGERLTLSHRREMDWIARSLRSCATLRVLTLRSKSHPSAFHFVSPPAVEPSPRVRESTLSETKRTPIKGVLFVSEEREGFEPSDL